MINELVNEMVDAGVHYGHQTKKWNPRMKPFLMKDKGGIYIINLEKTVQQLDKAAASATGHGDLFAQRELRKARSEQFFRLAPEDG